jgi:hypothetical protein
MRRNGRPDIAARPYGFQRVGRKLIQFHAAAIDGLRVDCRELFHSWLCLVSEGIFRGLVESHAATVYRLRVGCREFFHGWLFLFVVKEWVAGCA